MAQEKETRAATSQVGNPQAELTREWHWKNDLLSSTTPPWLTCIHDSLASDSGLLVLKNEAFDILLPA